MHYVTRTIFPVFAFKVTHRVILLTLFCKLLTRVATLSGGHVPQVPQWHDASEPSYTMPTDCPTKKENSLSPIKYWYFSPIVKFAQFVRNNMVLVLEYLFDLRISLISKPSRYFNMPVAINASCSRQTVRLRRLTC